MTTLYDLLPDSSAILALEPEELAGLALELIIAGEGNWSAETELHQAANWGRCFRIC